MSIEAILIPLGVAAWAAWRESRRTDLYEGCQTTTLTDAALLEEALHELDATAIEAAADKVTARIGYASVSFFRVEEVFVGRVDQPHAEATNTMLLQLEEATGKVLQRRSVLQIRQRAAELGLTLLTDHVADDGTVQLVYEESG